MAAHLILRDELKKLRKARLFTDGAGNYLQVIY